jgi:DNA-binding transcriptional LysR family regulator
MYGQALVRRGVAIFDELKQGVEELEFLADPTAGELRIGNSEATAASVLPVIVDQLLQQHPRINLKVFQAVFATTQYRELRERSIDLLLGRIPTPFIEEDLEAQVLFDDPIAVIAGRESRWARCRKLTLSDLANERWVLPPPESLPGSAIMSLFHALARISHTTECIGAANQREPLCRNNISSIRGAPRCRQSVSRISLDLNLLKAVRW